VVSLTAAVVVPLSVPVAVACATVGADLVAAAAFVLCSLVSVVLALSPELGAGSCRPRRTAMKRHLLGADRLPGGVRHHVVMSAALIWGAAGATAGW
jgi:hypothetical protein